MGKTVLGAFFLSIIGASTLVEVIKFQRPKDNNRACVMIDDTIYRHVRYELDRCDSLPMFIIYKDTGDVKH